MHEDPSGMLARIPFGLTTGPIEGAEILVAGCRKETVASEMRSNVQKYRDTLIIWDHFTDLCKQISARYLAQQRKQHEERMAGICVQIRQAMLILHEQGIYPGARPVSERLNNPHILPTIEGHEA
jgi:hypothetical protein